MFLSTDMMNLFLSSAFLHGALTNESVSSAQLSSYLSVCGLVVWTLEHSEKMLLRWKNKPFPELSWGLNISWAYEKSDYSHPFFIIYLDIIQPSSTLGVVNKVDGIWLGHPHHPRLGLARALPSSWSISPRSKRLSPSDLLTCLVCWYIFF